MGRVINLNALESYLEKLKKSGGMWEFKPNKWIMLHLEVEKLAALYNIETNIDLVHCNLEKDVAVVKAAALYNSKKYYSFGEVSPKNNDFPYVISIAEKRAVDRVILKALGIHGTVYSSEEMPNEKKTNNASTGIKLDHADIIEQRIKTCTHQANLEQLKSQNKDFLIKLSKQNLPRFNKLKQAFVDRNQQFIGG